ncbi:hypothetical protein KIN20_002927 [Parelaphostrongylus tenuis]|uniref:Uncharacterized protein n=1 Tax=Parelaphostrongylus tenuis TaxID=148309 RepID=A0AAD5MP65_PARTN|nr:hypothetical protein KIN20_002927 [Parelaphostrongylus tenuis]
MNENTIDERFAIKITEQATSVRRQPLPPPALSDQRGQWCVMASQPAGTTDLL